MLFDELGLYLDHVADHPPILHRKELLLPPDHPRREKYAELTVQAESIGLFDEPKRIGYQWQWLALVREKGYRIEGHALVPLENDETVDHDLKDCGCCFHSSTRFPMPTPFIGCYPASIPSTHFVKIQAQNRTLKKGFFNVRFCVKQ